jgi:hypothetical protein
MLGVERLAPTKDTKQRGCTARSVPFLRLALAYIPVGLSRASNQVFRVGDQSFTVSFLCSTVTAKDSGAFSNDASFFQERFIFCESIKGPGHWKLPLVKVRAPGPADPVVKPGRLLDEFALGALVKGSSLKQICRI